MTLRDLINEIIADEDFQQLHRLLNRESVFTIMNVKERELVHTHLLAWLLNPLAGHGMGSIPIKTFMHLVATALIKQKNGNGFKDRKYASVDFIDPVALSSVDLERLNVLTEHSFKKTDNESENRRRTDIFVCEKKIQGLQEVITPYLVVEYKVNADEYNNQTSSYSDYIDDLKAQHPQINNKTYYPLMAYVCKDSEDHDEPAEPFVIIDYKDFQKWINNLKSVNSKTNQGQFLVNEFAVLLQTLAPSAEHNDGLLGKLTTLYKTKYTELLNNEKDKNNKDQDIALDAVWQEYGKTLEILGVGYRVPVQAVLNAIDFLKQTLDPKHWEINGDIACMMVHNLDFRHAITQAIFPNSDGGLGEVKKPRLQIRTSEGEELKLLFKNTQPDRKNQRDEAICKFLLMTQYRTQCATLLRDKIRKDYPELGSKLGRQNTNVVINLGRDLNANLISTIKKLEKSISNWLESKEWEDLIKPEHAN
jgi:hypothetical protein